MNYIVSGHGGRYVTPKHYVWIPDGFEVVLFVPDDQVLSDKEAWPIYNHLLAGDEKSVQAKIVSRFLARQQVYNYSCWNYPELQWNSGVFKVGAITTKNPVIDISHYTESNPLTLDKMFSLLPSPGVIYWVACTSAS